MCCIMGQTNGDSQVLLARKEPLFAKTLGTVTPRKPVLSVSARKIKDNAADWHNLILKWEALNDGGFATANSIANMKISLLSKDKIELVSSGLASDDCAEKEHPEYSRELETLCEQLQATLEGLLKGRTKIDQAGSGLRTLISPIRDALKGCLTQAWMSVPTTLATTCGRNSSSQPDTGMGFTHLKRRPKYR
nr:cyclin-dependent kinase 2-interacting protein isoform X6 [Ovis aries]